MSSIGNVSGATNVSYLQPATNSAQSVARSDSDGDNDSSSGVGKVGKSNFLNAIEQALGQSMPGSTATSSATSASNSTSPSVSTQNPPAALQTFLHSLFAALHQGSGRGSAAVASGSDSNNPGVSSTPTVGRHHHGDSNLAANIQGLLQQLSSGSQGSSTNSSSGSNDAIGTLNSSFQNLINTINTSQAQGATSAAAPSLQSFLQNLLQDMSGGQSISGAVVSTKA